MGTQKKQSSRSRKTITKKTTTAKPLKRAVGGKTPKRINARALKREVGATSRKPTQKKTSEDKSVKREVGVKTRKRLTTKQLLDKDKGLKPIGSQSGGGLQAIVEAEGRLEERYKQLGAAFFGAVKSKEIGRIWRFAKGCLVHNQGRKAVFEIHWPIYEHWEELGGLKWGIPCTDGTKTPGGGGEYNHFDQGKGKENASIYYSSKSGVHCVFGEIRKRWVELGWEKSYLGYPTSDEVEFAEGGRVNEFENGGIYYWSDVGPIDLRDVVVNYTGLHCFGETDNDQTLSGGDEPYAVMGVTTPQTPGTFRSKIYEDIDAGQSCPDKIEISRGRPLGINIASTVIEHDAGDPDRYKEEVRKACEAAHAIGKEALGAIPIAGAGLKAAAGHLDKYVPKVADKINDWLGFGDDTIGNADLSLSAREMVMLAARTAPREHKGIWFKVETALISGHGASYKVFYDIVPA